MGKERNIYQLPPAHPGECAPAGNQTSNLLVRGWMLNQLNHSSPAKHTHFSFDVVMVYKITTNHESLNTEPPPIGEMQGQFPASPRPGFVRW